VTDRKSAELDAELAQWEAQRRPTADPDLDAWEAELNRREVELRRRELELRQRDLDRRESRSDDE
jgi:hypothetical protein